METTSAISGIPCRPTVYRSLQGDDTYYIGSYYEATYSDSLCKIQVKDFLYNLSEVAVTWMRCILSSRA